MTVKEMIDELSKYPPDYLIGTYEPEDDSYVSCITALQKKKCIVEDCFNYKIKSEGNLNVVVIY